MHADMTSLDWAVLVLFFVVMCLIGYLSTWLIRNTRDYFTGSGKMPWWLLGVSHHVSGYSAVAFTAYAAIAYNTGFTIYIWWAVPIAFACYFGLFFIVARWARLRTRFQIQSPLEFIAIRYDVATQQILAWLGVLLKVLDVGAKWVAVGLVITTFAPSIPFPVAVLMAVALGMFYSTLGGLWAGTITDFAMFLVQAVAAIAMLGIVLSQLGGFSAIWTVWDRLPPGHGDLFAGKYGTWTCIIGLTIANILGYNGGTWNLAQRFIAAPQGAQAKKVAFLSATLYLIWPLLLFFPMWAAPLLFPGIPADQQEQSFSMMVIKILPPGLTGLMLAALVSHTLTMTTADATAIASVLVRDVLPRYSRRIRTFSEKQSLFLARFVTFIFLLLTTVIALYNARFGGILGLILGWFSALLGPVSIPMILGLMPSFRRCGPWASHLAIVSGLVTFTVIKLGGIQLDFGYTILLPTLAAFVFYVGSGMFNFVIGKHVKPEVDEFLQGISSDAAAQVNPDETSFDRLTSPTDQICPEDSATSQNPARSEYNPHAMNS